jgi:bifunctional UDP-N-acetylglucosamine pyrophosphorylase/glucosamine-1-phosphate N-acetyltransferase
MSVSPHAQVGADVDLAATVSIGPFSIIGSVAGFDSKGPIRIGEDCIIGPHVVIYGSVTLGSRVVVDPFCRIGPHASVGDDTQILYGARIHEETSVGHHCIVGGNCPDRTTIGDHVVHLGRIAHGFHFPFAGDWDAPAEPGPTIGSHVAIGVNAIIVGPITIGDNTFILPGEIVRESLSGGGIWRGGKWVPMPNWQQHLRLLQPFSGPANRSAARPRLPRTSGSSE